MIVVIDDDEAQRVFAVQYLDMMFNGQERVRAYLPEEWESIDWDDTRLAIVDLMMNPTPGTVILAWLKENYPDIKRVAWSAAVPRRWASTNPIVEEARDLADTVISKVAPEELVEAIEKMRRDRA